MRQTGKRQKKNDLCLELFGFPKTLLRKVKKCSKMANTASKDIEYLWIRISKENDSTRKEKKGCILNLDDWLNIIDEAVSAGASWLVLTIEVPLDQMQEIIEVCKWAQDTYKMKVGLFLCRETITENEVQILSCFKKNLTQIFVKKKAFEQFKKINEIGLFLGIADPQEYGNKPNCEGASKLLYVDSEGSIYTCGLVAGKKNYKLGSIYDRKFHEIVKDPSLPHSVAEKIHKVDEGCDGCPSLLAKHLKNNPLPQ
ncbi:MAG TPA: SPASM domain-containing protein [Candidatus Hydrogenedens sp.]|nr:SPASM domain-containing protein [Candidatus Hydrogenedens sp.]